MHARVSSGLELRQMRAPGRLSSRRHPVRHCEVLRTSELAIFSAAGSSATVRRGRRSAILYEGAALRGGHPARILVPGNVALPDELFQKRLQVLDDSAARAKRQGTQQRNFVVQHGWPPFQWCASHVSRPRFARHSNCVNEYCRPAQRQRRLSHWRTSGRVTRFDAQNPGPLEHRLFAKMAGKQWTPNAALRHPGSPFRGIGADSRCVPIRSCKAQHCCRDDGKFRPACGTPDHSKRCPDGSGAGRGKKGPKQQNHGARRNSGWPWHHRGCCSRHLPRFHATCGAHHDTAARALESSPDTNKLGQ